MAKGKRFPPEFRQEAVRLYRVSGRPYRVVAEELPAIRGAQEFAGSALCTW